MSLQSMWLTTWKGITSSAKSASNIIVLRRWFTHRKPRCIAKIWTLVDWRIIKAGYHKAIIAARFHKTLYNTDVFWRQNKDKKNNTLTVFPLRKCDCICGNAIFQGISYYKSKWQTFLGSVWNMATVVPNIRYYYTT